MTGRTWDGRPLTPGSNVDRVDVQAGMDALTELGWPPPAGRHNADNELRSRTRMVVEYALRRWARGEEAEAERGAVDRHFYGVDMTSWRVVLAAAIAAAEEAAAAAAKGEETA